MTLYISHWYFRIRRRWKTRQHFERYVADVYRVVQKSVCFTR